MYMTLFPHPVLTQLSPETLFTRTVIPLTFLKSYKLYSVHFKYNLLITL